MQHSNHTALGRNSPEGFCTGHEPTQLLVRAAVILEIILGGSQYSTEPSSVPLTQVSTRASSCPAPVTELLLSVSAECPPQQHPEVQPQSTSCCFSTLSSGKRERQDPSSRCSLLPEELTGAEYQDAEGKRQGRKALAALATLPCLPSAPRPSPCAKHSSALGCNQEQH